MRKLYLPDEILLSVEKPARYIGGEVNMAVKNPEDVEIRFCMCFPDVYEVGMSHLGIQILYDMLNRREDTYCERVYSPWVDLDKIMREKNISLLNWIPIANCTAALNDIVVNKADAKSLVIIFASTIIYIVAIVIYISKQYSSEKTLFS